MLKRIFKICALRNLILSSLMILCFAAICDAQTVRLVEALPNGEHVVEIDGVQYRTISADHARQIEERKAELDKTRRERDLLNDEVLLLKRKIELLERDAQLADAKAQLERERAARFQQMFDAEHGLRLQSEKLIQRGRVAAFFDNPFTQILTKLAWPSVQTWLESRRRK